MSGPWEQFAQARQPAPASPAPQQGPWSRYSPPDADTVDPAVEARVAAPERQVGFTESALRTAGSAATPVVRMLGMAASTVARLFGESAQQGVLQTTEDLTSSMDRAYKPQAGEKFNTAGQLVGGVASAPIEFAGGLGAQRGIERAANVVERGGSLPEAAKAGAVTGGVHAALNVLPVKAGGALGRAVESRLGGMLGGAVTGGAIQTAGGAAGRAAENAALPEGEQYQPLRQDIAPSAADVGLGMALGAVPGAVSGARGALAAKAEGRAPKGVVGKLLPVSPEMAEVGQAAAERGIDLAPHQLTSSPMVRKAGQLAETLGFLGGKEGQQTALNRAVVKMIDPEGGADKLTPEVFAAAMNKSGKTIGDVATRTEVPVDSSGLAKDLESHAKQMGKETQDVASVNAAYIKELKEAADAGNGVIPGEKLQNIISELGRKIRGASDGNLRDTLADLQSSALDALRKSVKNPEDAAAFDAARKQYAIGITLEPMVAKTIEGNVPASQLMARATATKEGKRRMARDIGGELGDLAKIGQLMKDPASSGTAERNLLYRMAGLGGASAGAIYEPHVAAGALGAAGLSTAYNAASPAIGRAMIRKGLRSKGGVEQALAPAPESELVVQSQAAKPPAAEILPVEPRAPTETAPVVPMAEQGAPPAAPETAAAQAPEPIPVGEATETNPPAPVDSRLAEVERLRGEADSPAVQKALDAHAKTIEKEIAKEKAAAQKEADVKSLDEAASKTLDPALRKTLTEQANKLRAETIPVGETKELETTPTPKEKVERIPVGRTKELATSPVKVEKIEPPPVGEATVLDVPPEFMSAWRAKHKLGADGERRALDAVAALDKDEAAGVAAATKFEFNPEAFDAEIARIRAGEGNASKPQENYGGGNGAAAATASQGESGVSSSGGAGGEAQPQTAGLATASRAAGQPTTGTGPAFAAEGGSASVSASGVGGAVRAEPVKSRAKPDALGQSERHGRVLSKVGDVSIVEKKDGTGFVALDAQGKEVGHLNDNMKAGMAEQFNENANVSDVAVDKEHRGTGVGQALYKAFEQKHEGRILPSGQTTIAAWNRWKKDYPEKVSQFVQAEVDRVKDGADPGHVIRNITDPEVRGRVAEGVTEWMKGRP